MTMRRAVVILLVALGLALGCNAIFGIGDYVVTDEAGSDGSTNDGDVDANCKTPTTDPELLNACTNSQCVPFDDTVRVPRLAADGALPPVPDPVDAAAS
jgi:hypothetical protein